MQDSSTVDGGPREPGLRERKKHARREALIDAAHALVDEHGLEAVTVEAVCRRAGVSARTFFNYFQSKDDAVLGLAPWTLDPDLVETFVGGGPSGHLPTDLAALVRGLVERPPVSRQRLACLMELAHREHALVARQVLAFHRHHQEIAEVIGRRLDLPPTHAQVEVVTSLVMAVVRGSYVQWYAGDGTGPVSDLVPDVIATMRDLLTD